MSYLIFLIKAIICLCPWIFKRRILNRFWGYQLHPSSKIGFSWVYPRHLTMAKGSKINHFNVAIHLDEILMEAESVIERGNWITGFPSGLKSAHFAHQPKRVSRLRMGSHSAITKNHHLDCTNEIQIGSHATIAGYGSQFLTHSIDLQENRQDSRLIQIGDYCFIGTDVVVLGGAILPSHSVLAAKSLLNKAYSDDWHLYAGVPAIPKGEIPKSAKYFTRKEGFVY